MKKIDSSKDYPLLPLRDVVVLPHMVVPLFVGRENSVKALDEAMKTDRLILLVTQLDAQVASPSKDDIYSVGTLAEILQLLKLPDGTIKVLVEGVTRVYVTDMDDEGSPQTARIRDIERGIDTNPEIAALKKTLLDTFEKYIKLNKKVPKEALNTAGSIDEL